MQSFWCICIRISIIQLKVCKTDRIVYEDTTAGSDALIVISANIEGLTANFTTDPTICVQTQTKPKLQSST